MRGGARSPPPDLWLPGHTLVSPVVPSLRRRSRLVSERLGLSPLFVRARRKEPFCPFVLNDPKINVIYLASNLNGKYSCKISTLVSSSTTLYVTHFYFRGFGPVWGRPPLPRKLLRDEGPTSERRLVFALRTCPPLPGSCPTLSSPRVVSLLTTHFGSFLWM